MVSVSSPPIPRQAVPSGFSITSGFDMELKKDASGALTLVPIKPWKGIVWPVAIGIVIYLLEPPLRWASALYSGLQPHPTILDEFRGGILICSLVFGGLFGLFFYFVGKWTPATRFDLADNSIYRHAIQTKFTGVHSRVEEVRMKISDAQGIQLCYGGFSEGDSESPGFDWWQLLIVGLGNPPYRAILAQSGDRTRTAKAGQEIAAYLSVPFIDDGDIREGQTNGDKKGYGFVNAQGMFVTTGSTADSECDPAEIAQAAKRALHQNDRIYGWILLAIVAAVAFTIWFYMRPLSGLDWSEIFKPGRSGID